MAFPAMQAQILLDTLAASDYSAYLLAYQPGSLPLHTIPDRATRLLLGEVARADPTTTGRQEIQPDRSQEVLRRGRWVSSLVWCCIIC